MERGVEFYIYESELWCKYSDGRNEIFDESNTELIQFVLGKIRDCYPQAYEALSEYYNNSAANVGYFQYVIVRRFINCNFSSLDATSIDIEDIGIDGRFNFEKVPCPLRCECKMCGIVCTPKFNSSLSQQELRIGKMWIDGMGKDDIATKLYLSPETVNNHIRNIYAKLNINSKTELFAYAEKNGLFS